MFTLGLAQCACPTDVSRWAREAKAQGVDLLVFPEALMTRFDGSVENFVRASQPLDGPFAREVDAAAAREGIWIVYTVNERNERGGLPFNTAVVTDSDGRQRARYRKVHLFDAQGFSESERMAAGDELMQPLDAPFARIGLGICYDLRFPEVARAAALSGADIMVYPAAWVAGPSKIEQWETLLSARAIENGMFVAGVCCVNEGRIGHSCVFAPDGSPRATSDGAEQLVTCVIDCDEIVRVRGSTPSLQHRRPDCYNTEASL